MTGSVSRPASQLVRPVRLDRAFADPEQVVELVRRGSPYRTEEAVHRHPGVERTGGWFRNFWSLGGKVVFEGADDLFHNDIYLAAAHEHFAAEVVRPVAMMTNLNLPMAGLPPHLDLPFFRGAMNREVPAWMLAPMGYSGLFDDWAVPVASAISWFSETEGGDFEYWPDGMESPALVERPPFFNVAVMADNEYMYHRVGPTGPVGRHVPDDGVPFEAELVLVEGDCWQVRHDGATLGDYAADEVRVSVLWKAYCFATAAEAAAYDDHTDDLTPARVTRIFLDDLRANGVDVAEPDDVRTDLAWKRALLAAYPAADVA